MSNVPPDERSIGDMVAGEVGYTVPWAYDRETDTVDECYSIGNKGEMASLRVDCIQPGVYVLTFALSLEIGRQ
jgi:hypothetical protein